MKCPLITMSAITGKPTRSDIYEYLLSLHDNGISQVMLYPRSECEIEYLSEEWFTCIGSFIECAKELDMSIWLYDDFNWPSGDVGGKLNGISIACNASSHTLPREMRNLYNYSSACALKQGKNIIESKCDYKYLPSVVLMGDFAYEIKNGENCSLHLTERKKEYICGEKILDYGKIEFCANAYIPIYCNAIEICGADLLTEVYINDTLTSKKAFPPYVYDLSEDLQDKTVKIKIVQYSSVAPIFGDVAYWDKSVKECGRRGTPSTKNVGFGFEKIKFIIKEGKI